MILQDIMREHMQNPPPGSPMLALRVQAIAETIDGEQNDQLRGHLSDIAETMRRREAEFGLVVAALAQSEKDYAALRARVARARSLLLKLCESADHMPDDVAEWLHDEPN